MEKKLINEVLGEIAPNDIVMRRRSPLTGLMVLLIGIVLLILNFTSSGDSESGLQAGAAIGGVIASCIGLVMLVIAFTGSKSVPWSVAEQKPLRKQSHFYSFTDRDRVADAVRRDDRQALAAIHNSESSAVVHICWTTPSGKLRIEQVQEYIPHRYEPVTEVIVRQTK